ncbi:MAG TPA: hypothetical protein VEY71_08640, partial [Chitinophagales bacterium]|nr:hypothetical protein [Chitinophagales bacterium]
QNYYSYTVTDAVGSTAKSGAVMWAHATNQSWGEFDFNFLVTPNPDCGDTVCGGSAEVVWAFSSGFPPFVYHWSNGATGAAVTGLCSGAYTVSVLDAFDELHERTVIVPCMSSEQYIPDQLYFSPEQCPYTQARVETAVESIAATVVTCSPNPFLSSSDISFTLPQEDSEVVLEVFNTIGLKVAEVFRGPVRAGVRNTATFNGSEMAEGIYIYRLTSTLGVHTGYLVRAR